MTANPSTAAVVVTHNRLKLLKRCVTSILNQSKAPVSIIIVDNNSTDGTAEWVAQNDKLIYLHQKNTGSAGGFHAGIGYAYTKGHEYIWALDDDGYADTFCLEHLLGAASSSSLYLAPIVIDESADDMLAFALTGRPGIPDAYTVNDAIKQSKNGFIENYACPFNGVLFHRQLIDLIGLPDPRFFCWGEERDYTERARRVGHHPTTVVAALYWHPRDRYELAHFEFMGKELRVPYVASEFKQYISERNNAFLAMKYRGLWGLFQHLVTYSAFYLSRHDWKRTLQSLIYSMHGIIGRWNYPQTHFLK